MFLKKIGFYFIAILAFTQSVSVHAIPTRTEAYRNDHLKTIVYKDSEDPNVFWYLPPVKLLEKDGQVVTYKRVKGTDVLYTFYLVPYMTEDLIQMLTGEITGFTNRSQLRPIPVQKFGVKLDSFNASYQSEVAANFQYLNMPQLVKVNLKDTDADDFDFFLSNLPGVPVQVLFTYESEKLSKFLSIDLSYKEVYNALKVGVNGKYKFTKGEIALGIENYVGTKYLTIKSKGELPIPEIVNKVIEECFTPVNAKSVKKPIVDVIDEIKKSSSLPSKNVCQSGNFKKQIELNLNLIENIKLDIVTIGELSLLDDEKTKTTQTKTPTKVDDSETSPTTGGGDGPEIQFSFKKDMANNDKKFFFRQEQFVDSSETVSVPSYLSTMPLTAKSDKSVTSIGKWNFVVGPKNDSKSIFTSEINVGRDEQYVISAAFSYRAETTYSDGMNWYRWDTTWPSADDELYYHIGAGPWTRVSGRAVVHADSVYQGPLEFYIDRNAWFEKLPDSYRKGKLGGIIPPIFTYAKTYPQFNVTVSGRKILYSK